MQPGCTGKKRGLSTAKGSFLTWVNNKDTPNYGNIVQASKAVVVLLELEKRRRSQMNRKGSVKFFVLFQTAESLLCSFKNATFFYALKNEKKDVALLV